MTDASSTRFITLEGGEGAGKSTHARHLSQALRAHGIDNIVTREPGGSPGAEQIRALLVEGEPNRWDAVVETLLLFAARADHITQTIKPALSAGKWVICDRFTDSTYAYQGAGRGLDPKAIERIEAAAIGDFHPDLTLILDVPVGVALGRIGGRAHDETRFEKFDRAFHERLRQFFQKLAQREPERCILINTDAPTDDISGSIWQTVATHFGL